MFTYVNENQLITHIISITMFLFYSEYIGIYKNYSIIK